MYIQILLCIGKVLICILVKGLGDPSEKKGITSRIQAAEIMHDGRVMALNLTNTNSMESGWILNSGTAKKCVHEPLRTTFFSAPIGGVWTVRIIIKKSSVASYVKQNSVLQFLLFQKNSFSSN